MSSLSPSDVVAYLRMKVLKDGSLSLEGNIGDVHLALGMVDAAADELKRRMNQAQEGIIILGRDDVGAPINEKVYPVQERGDALPRIPVPRGPDVVIGLLLSLYATGAMSIEGDTTDRRILRVLASARTTVAGRLGRPSILEPTGVVQ